MIKKIQTLKFLTLLLFVTQILLFVIIKFIFQLDKLDILLYVFFSMDVIWVIYMFVTFDSSKKKMDDNIVDTLDKQTKQALEYGQVGIIIYDEKQNVTYQSDFVSQRKICEVGKKLSEELELNKIVNINGLKYEIHQDYSNNLIFVKDVNDYINITQKYENERLVMGLINLDNYNETINTEDEQTIAAINTNIREAIINYIMNNGGVVRRLKGDRLFAFASEVSFRKMTDDRFSILETIKQQADYLNVSITASMAFAKGSDDIQEIDDTVNNMMDLVLSRGGDQVTVKEIGKEVVFYGSSSAASEKNSKVKSRIMAKNIGEHVHMADKVFIVVHDMADLDAFGSALAFSNIVNSYEKNAYIIFNDVNIEEKTKEIFENFRMELAKEHVFISPREADSLIDDMSLVVAIDHHSTDLSIDKNIFTKSKKNIVIDHHRRKTENNIESIIFYDEPSASSSVELLTELMQYSPNVVNVTELEATIMYCGLLVDTENLKARTTSRSFEACAWLKKHDADITLANDWLKDTLEDSIKRTNILKNMQDLGNGIVVCGGDEDIDFTRTSLSQAANYLCTLKGVEAAFAIGKINRDDVGISGRSNDKINVQLILEKMGGGGHYNAAGLQRNKISVQQLKEELIESINDYQTGGTSNESNITE